MIQLSISQFCSRRWTFFQDVIRYASWGINQIGVWREKLTDLDLDEAIDLLDEMQLSVSSLSWAGGFTGSNGLSYEEAVEDARRAIEMAHMLRAGCLVVHPGAQNGHTDRHVRRLLTHALEELVPHADDYDVRLAIEPTLAEAPSSWNFLSTIDEHLKIIERFPAEHLGLVLDTYHLGDREHLRETLSGLVDRVALVQLADFSKRGRDGRRISLGRGMVPLQHWLSALNRAGYQGPVEIEIHGGRITPDRYREVLEDSLQHVQAISDSLQRSPSNSARQDRTG